MCHVKALWEALENDLPIDRQASWSIGSANATRNRVYGLCHSVSINVGGVQVEVPVFVMEGAAQDMILGRTWERKVRAQYDNRADGSLHITISTPDDEKVVTFWGVEKNDERNKSRARTSRNVTTATTARTTLEEAAAAEEAEKEKGSSFGVETASQEIV